MNVPKTIRWFAIPPTNGREDHADFTGNRLGVVGDSGDKRTSFVLGIDAQLAPGTRPEYLCIIEWAVFDPSLRGRIYR